MATVRVWALHGNVQNAINYICADDKTEKSLKECKDCTIGVAAIEWKAKRELKNETVNSINEIVGYHFQQSFEVGSIAYEEAFEIGKEWIERVTGGQYDYVMAVHTDKPNPHVHFIVNPTNKVTGKQMQIFYKKDLPSFKEISDRICVEHGKAVLEQPLGKGKTYYEWLMKNQGDSIKDVISKTLESVISKVHCYEDMKIYLTKLGYEIEDGLDEGGNTSTLEKENSYFDEYKFSAHKGLFVSEKESDNKYFVRVPNTKGQDYIMLPKINGEWTSKKDVFFSSFALSDEFDVYDKNGNITGKKSAVEIKDNWEDKVKKEIGRQGLRIKAPHSKKFIRCHNLEPNKNGLGYSLNEVLERIENNGCFRTSEYIENFIHDEKTNKADVIKGLNQLYEEANIRTKWKDSRYYEMSKKERYVEYKTKELQMRLNNIHDQRIGSDDIHIVDALGEDRKILRTDLTNVSKELKVQEIYYEEIYMDMLADRLEVSQKELDDFVKDQIEPLQNQKKKLKDEISNLSKRINIAQSKINKEQEREKNR